MTTTAERMVERQRWLDQHEAELRRAGMYDEDASYGPGAIAKEVLKLLDTWHEQGHSGGSASLTLFIFNKLVNHKVLSPITDSPDEWMDVSEYNGPNAPAMWQNRRQSTLFSHDGGQTYYDIDERRSWWRRKLGLGHKGFHVHESLFANDMSGRADHRPPLLAESPPPGVLREGPDRRDS